ncbi:MAG: FAD binding domain-containing protein [Acidimicrobiales bacterium]
MYPARFDYEAPETLDAALAVFAERGEDARVLAGGQSLIPMMKLRFATPAALVDVNRVPGLDHIDEADGQLRLGALVRHNAIVGSALVHDRNHVMAAAAPWIADPLVRNLGTIGGSLAHADPEGDWASVMLACRGEVVATSTSGQRVIPMAELISGPFTTSLQPGEMLTEVRVPIATRPNGGAYLKLERKVGDYATVAVATRLELDPGTGHIADAGIALTSVAPSNLQATAAEQVLVGEAPGEELFAEAAELAAQAARPRRDVRGSEEYKRHVVKVYVRRGLARCHELATAAAPS